MVLRLFYVSLVSSIIPIKYSKSMTARGFFLFSFITTRGIAVVGQLLCACSKYLNTAILFSDLHSTLYGNKSLAFFDSFISSPVSPMIAERMSVSSSNSGKDCKILSLTRFCSLRPLSFALLTFILNLVNLRCVDNIHQMERTIGIEKGTNLRPA